MRIAQNKMQKIKAGLHCFQALLVFLAGCLTLAVMTKAGGYGGSTAFYFALCFFTLPALLYQVMVPLWSRAWRLNNVYAFFAIDALFTVLWFAAFVAVAVWNAHGISKGRAISENTTDNTTKTTRRDDIKKDGTCASFGYGSKAKCQVSQATVGLGVIICVVYALTTYFAVDIIMEFRKTGVKPTAGVSTHYHGKEKTPVEDDPNKDSDPWSTNTDELNGNERSPYPQLNEDQTGLLRNDSDVEANQSTDAFAHPGRRLSYQSSAHNIIPPSYDANFAPSALSPTGLPTSPSGRVQFSEANYNALR